MVTLNPTGLRAQPLGRGLRAWLLICALATSPQALMAEVIASVSQANTSLEETIQLKLEFINQNLNEPDLSVLEKDFEVLGRQRSNSMQITNGKMSSSSALMITLRPIRKGQITIPSFTIDGEKTQALNLQVTDVPRYSNKGDQPVIIKSSVSSTRPTQGQQFIYSVDIYFADDVPPQTRLGSPQARQGNAEFIPLDDGPSSDTSIKGKRYKHLQKRYAVVAQDAGKLTIAPAKVTVMKRDKRFGSLFGNDPFFEDLNFGFGREMPFYANSITLDVQAAHSQLSSASKLEVIADVPPQPWQTGQPYNINVQVVAHGAKAEAIADIKVPFGKAFKVYPEAASYRNESNQQGVIGIKQQRFVIIPQTPGDFALEGISVPWYDNQNQQNTVSNSEPLNINVTGAALNAAPNKTTPSTAAPKQKQSASTSPKTTAKNATAENTAAVPQTENEGSASTALHDGKDAQSWLSIPWWQWLAFAFIAVFGGRAWLRHSRQKETHSSSSAHTEAFATEIPVSKMPVTEMPATKASATKASATAASSPSSSDRPNNRHNDAQHSAHQATLSPQPNNDNAAMSPVATSTISRAASAPTADEAQSALAALKQACQNNDAKACHVALQQWVLADERTPSSLQALTEEAPESFKQAMSGLNQHLFSEKPEPWSAKPMVRAVQAYLNDLNGQGHGVEGDEQLDDIYPHTD